MAQSTCERCESKWNRKIGVHHRAWCPACLRTLARRSCARCNERFAPRGLSGTSRTYCTPCAVEYRREYKHGRRPSQVDQSCQECGNVRPAGTSKFCSAECRYPKRAGCITCGKPRPKHAHRCPPCAAEATKDRYRRKGHKRRMAAVGVAGSDRYTLREIADRDGHRCHLCGLAVNMSLSGMDGRGPTIDHLVPISKHGPDTKQNVALAHRDCNVARGNRGFAQLRLTG